MCIKYDTNSFVWVEQEIHTFAKMLDQYFFDKD